MFRPACRQALSWAALLHVSQSMTMVNIASIIIIVMYFIKTTIMTIIAIIVFSVTVVSLLFTVILQCIKIRPSCDAITSRCNIEPVKIDSELVAALHQWPQAESGGSHEDSSVGFSSLLFRQSWSGAGSAWTCQLDKSCWQCDAPPIEAEHWNAGLVGMHSIFAGCLAITQISNRASQDKHTCRQQQACSTWGLLCIWSTARLRLFMYSIVYVSIHVLFIYFCIDLVICLSVCLSVYLVWLLIYLFVCLFTHL